MASSEPWWPEQPTASAGAPNVIVMLCDDLGFADLGCYGSEIQTPHLDRLAEEGPRYTYFHVHPMCLPSRASLHTGLNHHFAGLATVCHRDPGFPGHAMELRENAVTMAEVLQNAGWATMMVGKWHLCKDSNLTEAGPRHSWPCQKGFDRFYGILDGFTNFHQPHRLYEDNHVVQVDQYPEEYYFTDDLTDRAVDMVRQVRSGHPNKPWFLYFAHAAVHAPLQVKNSDAEKYRGDYFEGWDCLRQRRFKRQQQLGVVPSGVVLPPRNTEERHSVQAWEDLSNEERELFARYQEIYAGMVDNVDQNFGRLRAELEAMGEWDNTVVLFTSDNGASREGQECGTSSYFRTLIANARGSSPFDDLAVDFERIGIMGGPQTLPHYPMGWAMVSGTPFRLYKINTHQGGHQVPCIFSKGKGLRNGGELRTQYQHVTDLLPTILDLVNIDLPTTKNGRILPVPAGASFLESLSDCEAPSTHTQQYYEQSGHRGFYRDGWSAVTCHGMREPFSEDIWELHHLSEDPTEVLNLAFERPDLLAELEEAWETAAWANQVFPLDINYIQRPPWEEVLADPVTLLPGTPTLERFRSTQLIMFRSFVVDVSLTFSSSDNGVLVAHGDQGGGYSLYVEDGRLYFAYNGYGVMTLVDAGVLPADTSQISLVVEAPGEMVVHAEVCIDREVAGRAFDLPMLTAMAPFEGIDVGVDRRSPVFWSIYERHGVFPWTGSLHSVTYTPGNFAPDAGSRWLDVLRANAEHYD